MGSKKTTSAVAILALFDILKDHGLAVWEIEKKTGIDRAKMEDPDTRITMDQFLLLWQIAQDVTGDPAIGLHLRRTYGKGYMHFAIMIAVNSENLLEAAKSWADYAMLVCDTDRVALFEQKDHVVCSYSCSVQAYENRWIPEHHFSYVVQYGRKMSGTDLNPVEVWFKHGDPGYPEAYKKIFRCPVYFNKNENLMILKKEDVFRPIISPDPYLKALLKKHADSLKGQNTRESSLKHRVKSFITRNLPTGTVSAQAAADAMNMDRSTLHRHLKKEDLSFKTLLTDTRKELAKKHLVQGLTASQTAYLLGFGEPSTFHHAFKRWYGMSPGEFRKKFTPTL